VEVRDYYTGDYTVCLNLYSFNVNIIAWLDDRKPAPKLDTFSAIKWAKQAGFSSVVIPMYYVRGYEGTAMPSKPTAEIVEFVQEIKKTADDLGLTISGTGIGNDYANADPQLRELDIQRTLFWLDMAAVMGAGYMRVFSGFVPTDFDNNWEEIIRNRIVPILYDITVYAAYKGVKIGLQNHGDMTSTAEQTIQVLKWVNHPNIGIVDDTGYFRPFLAETGANYDWYSDIATVLPYSLDLQVKRKPAGADLPIMMDYHKLFTELRYSPYRSEVSLERLWYKDDPDNPKYQPTPPYTQVEEFLQEVLAALEATKVPPSVNSTFLQRI